MILPEKSGALYVTSEIHCPAILLEAGNNWSSSEGGKGRCHFMNTNVRNVKRGLRHC